MDKVKIDFSLELRNQELISDIINNDPYIIARLMEVFVEIYDKKEPDRAFREMIKLFASTFKYTGLIIISDYLSLLRQNRLPDAKLTKMIDNFLYVNLKGMSMGHWQFCLREITRLATNNDIELIVPELIPLYWKNKKKLSNVAKWIDNKMIPLRNDYVHSDIWLDSEMADKMIQEYFPNLLAYINEIKFFRNYPLLQDEENRFYVENKNKEKLTLEYFIIYSQKDEWSKEEMLLYETLKGKSIKYLLGNFYNFESEYIDNIKEIKAILKERLSEFESVGEKVDTTNEIVGKLEENIISGTKTLQTAFKGLTGNEQITQQIKQTLIDLKNSLDNFESVKSHLNILKSQLQLQKDDDWHRYQTASILNLYREIFGANGGKFDLKEFESLFIDRYEIHQHYNKFIKIKNTNLCFILAESGSGKTTFCQKIAIDYFKKNITRNNCKKNVLLFEGVVSDVVGLKKIKTIKGMEEYSTIGNITQKDLSNFAIDTINVESTTLDYLVNKYNLKPGLVKIDTEGAEFLVLLGATNILKEFKPIIISELCDDYLATLGNNSIEVLNLLKKNNYKIFNPFNPNKEIQFPFTGEIIAIPL